MAAAIENLEQITSFQYYYYITYIAHNLEACILKADLLLPAVWLVSVVLYCLMESILHVQRVAWISACEEQWEFGASPSSLRSNRQEEAWKRQLISHLSL